MTKILVVISKFLPEYSGAATRISQLYKRLTATRPDLDVSFLCNSTSIDKSSQFEVDTLNITRISVPNYYRKLFSAFPDRLENAIITWIESYLSWREIKKTHPDVVHIIGTSGATIAANYWANKKNIPRLIELVTSEASAFQYLPGLRYDLRLNRNTAVIAISAQLAEKCRQQGLTGQTWHRPNPVDNKRFFPEPLKRLNYREMLGPYQSKDILLCMVAKFMPQKNQLFLLEVLALLPRHYKLLLAGPIVDDGHLAKRDQTWLKSIQARAEKSDIYGRVSIKTGFVDTAVYIKASDIYLLPNKNEGLGTPMLEAIACGVPVVANGEEPAFQEWITDNSTGRLCKMSPRDWAKTIIAISKFDHYSPRSHKIHEICNLEVHDKNYLRLLDTLVKRPGYIDIKHIL
ncbi:glycosyltransferase family 4 protein [Thalassospira tepidiphila]|uniref:glycosyltransferase family 4 protein n=1 Tax=Thalassospira tepidiphila TaxID=393657 RepID=UPI003AA7EDF7